MNGLDDVDEESQELQVGAGVIPRRQQVLFMAGRQRPVVVLSASVEPGKGFFPKQDPESMLDRDLLHQVHDQQIMVDCYVGFLEHRGALVLPRGDLVVTGQDGDPKLEGFQLELLHEILNTYWNGTEVVIVHLLPLGRLATEDGPAAEQQIGSGIEKALVHQEILLLPAQRGVHMGDRLVEIPADHSRSDIQSVIRLEQGCLVV